MKRRTLLSLVLVCTLCDILAAQTPQDLFNQALLEERAAGNLPEAIRLYQRAAGESSDRVLAAQALINAARAYERLGQTEASRNLYTQIVRAFPEQAEQVLTANQRLAQTGVVQGTVRSTSGEPVSDVKVKLSGGPIDPEAFNSLQAFFKDRGIDIKPPANGLADQRFFQELADAAAARNFNLTNYASRAAVDAFQARNDSRFAGTTDTYGRFSIANVPPGQYTFSAERDGFFPAPADRPGANIASVAPGRTTLIDAVVSRGAAISGRVTDAAGQPMVNLRVQLYSVGYQAGFPILQPGVSRMTDDQGDYRLFWLTPGEYFVAAVPEGSLGAAALNSNLVAVINSASGLVRPAADTTPPRTFYPGTPDPSLAIPVFVRGEAPVSGVDIVVRRIQTFHIRGEIHANIPFDGATSPPATLTGSVAIRPRAAANPDDYAEPQTGVTLRLSGGQYIGSFDMGNVLPGAYSLKAYVLSSDNSRPGGTRGAAVAEVDISNGDASGVSFDIYPNVTVPGIVTVNGGAPGKINARVSLHPDGALGRSRIHLGVASRPVMADGQTGAFALADVYAGAYHVQVGPGLPPDVYVQDVRQTGRSIFDTGLEVRRDNPAPIEVLLSSGARTVEGTVRDRTGKPVAGATAVLVPPRERRQNRARYYSAKADASGHFRIQGVAPGIYSLFSWQNLAEGAYFNDRFVSRNEDAGRLVSVVQESAAGMDIVQIPAVGN